MADTKEPVHVKLDAAVVAAPIMQAVVETIQVANTCLAAIEKSEPSSVAEAVSSRGFTFQIRAAERPVEETRVRHSNWILSKGFQELARGVRESLERAHIFIALVEFAKAGGKEFAGLRKTYEDAQRWAENARFPQLMEAVSSKLTSPLNFEKEFLSLQDVRNCLEHSNGHVTAKRAGSDGALKLSFPRMKVFYLRGEEEIDVVLNEVIDPGHEGGAVINMRMMAEERTWKVGETVKLNPGDFADIGWGCWAFASELQNKLPRL